MLLLNSYKQSNVSQNNLVSNGSWTTLLDLDFSTQTNQTLSSDTTYTINGKVYTKYKSANDQVSMAIVNESGLIIQPKVGAGITDVFAGTYGAPTLYIPLTSLSSSISIYTPIKATIYISNWNGAAQYDFVGVGFVDTVTKTNFNTACLIINRPGRNVTGKYTYLGASLADLTQANANDNVISIYMPFGVTGQTALFSSCAYTSWLSNLPLINRMKYTQADGACIFLSVDNYAVSIYCGAGGSGTSGLSATIKNFTVEALL
jgi:hypothetical protein